MNQPFAPHRIISPAIVRQLREASADAERAGSLTPSQLSLINEEGWFRMFLPKSLGGLELSLPEGLRLEEALAWVDGSLGWTVTLCSGATMFAGFMEPAVATSLLADPATCFGGSGHATGTAAITSDGFLVSGKWRYATGAPHLSVFTANCKMEQDGIPLLDADGEELQQSFFFLRDEVHVTNDWHSMGLKATAGHTFEIHDLHVPNNRTFLISPDAAKIGDPIYQYPFLPFAEATLAVNTLGMATHFLDICEQLFADRASSKRYREELTLMLNSKMIQARHELTELRNNFYNTVEHSWAPVVHGLHARPDTLQAVSVASRTMFRECRNIVQELFPYCGMAAADPDTELNRVWRDLFTASQHTLLTYPAS